MQDVSAATSFELVSPSFSAYFADDDIAQTAARVRHEVLAGADPESPTQLSRYEDFEFAALQPDPYLPSLSSFPIFSRVRPEEDPVSVIENRGVVADDKLEPIRISFGKLLVDDGDLPSSSSSGEKEELEGVPRGAFCMWSQRRPAPSGCRKSNSTGSSSSGNPKRWRLTDLILRRSKSDGKRLPSPALTVFPNSTYPATKKSEDKKRLQKVLPSPPPHEFFYGRNGMKKEGERRRTYLPYRKDLVGIFGNGHGLGRNNARS